MATGQTPRRRRPDRPVEPGYRSARRERSCRPTPQPGPRDESDAHSVELKSRSPRMPAAEDRGLFAEMAERRNAAVAAASAEAANATPPAAAPASARQDQGDRPSAAASSAAVSAFSAALAAPPRSTTARRADAGAGARAGNRGRKGRCPGRRLALCPTARPRRPGAHSRPSRRVRRRGGRAARATHQADRGPRPARERTGSRCRTYPASSAPIATSPPPRRCRPRRWPPPLSDRRPPPKPAPTTFMPGTSDQSRKRPAPSAQLPSRNRSRPRPPSSPTRGSSPSPGHGGVPPSWARSAAW